jgi:hypothetical protein
MTADDYPRYVDLTRAQSMRLGQILSRFLAVDNSSGVTIQQTDEGKLLVTSPESGQQWKVGVKGGGS